MYRKMQESELIEIIPLMCTSAIWGQYLVYVLWGVGCFRGCLQLVDDLMKATSFVDWYGSDIFHL